MHNQDENSFHKSVMEYEKHLKEFIEANYDLKVTFLTVMNWGYTTTTYFCKTKTKKFVVRISDYSEDKRLGLEKDILVSDIIGNDFPIPNYIKSVDGKYLLKYKDYISTIKLLRISNYMGGVAAFNITMQNVAEMVEFLKKLHYGISQRQLVELKKAFGATNGIFLHGDLTPTNCLLSFNKVSDVVDFEHSFFGPVEYDLARTAVFSWFHLNEFEFGDITNVVLSTYEKSINIKDYTNYAKQHLQQHYENILKHEQDYKNREDFTQDKDFTEKMLKRLT